MVNSDIINAFVLYRAYQHHCPHPTQTTAFLNSCKRSLPAIIVETQYSYTHECHAHKCYESPWLTYRGACPEGTRVPNGGRVAEGQSSKGQRHHGAAEQQLQQAEREQRPPGQQQPRSAARDPGRGGQATGSVSVRRLYKLRSPGNRTARPRQHHWERHFDRLEENEGICRSLCR